MPHGEPSLTIVTVVMNDAPRLQRTLESVARLKCERVEYLVVDGGSTDGTLDLIRAHEGLVDRWVSEPDRGIYDAMNKATGLSRGRYLMYLNAGDELLVDVCALVEDSPADSVMLYGRANMLFPDGSLSYVKGKRISTPQRFLKGMPLCHQAIIYRREVMQPYDTSFRIMSDRLLTYRLVRQYGMQRTRFLDATLVNYYEDGYSNSLPWKVWHDEQNRLYRAVGKEHYIVLKTINAIFKWVVKEPLKACWKKCWKR
jgi:glycosyltransferase involved in cell wall biosynthesis